jgi:adenylosuccinate synthase
LTKEVPYDTDAIIEPVYIEMKAWSKDLTQVTSANDFPSELNDYIAFIEKELNLPITIVSVGPDRKQIIFR